MNHGLGIHGGSGGSGGGHFHSPSTLSGGTFNGNWHTFSSGSLANSVGSALLTNANGHMPTSILVPPHTHPSPTHSEIYKNMMDGAMLTAFTHQIFGLLQGFAQFVPNFQQDPEYIALFNISKRMTLRSGAFYAHYTSGTGTGNGNGNPSTSPGATTVSVANNTQVPSDSRHKVENGLANANSNPNPNPNPISFSGMPIPLVPSGPSGPSVPSGPPRTPFGLASLTTGQSLPTVPLPPARPVHTGPTVTSGPSVSSATMTIPVETSTYLNLIKNVPNPPIVNEIVNGSTSKMVPTPPSMYSNPIPSLPPSENKHEVSVPSNGSGGVMVTEKSSESATSLKIPYHAPNVSNATKTSNSNLPKMSPQEQWVYQCYVRSSVLKFRKNPKGSVPIIEVEDLDKRLRAILLSRQWNYEEFYACVVPNYDEENSSNEVVDEDDEEGDESGLEEDRPKFTLVKILAKREAVDYLNSLIDVCIQKKSALSEIKENPSVIKNVTGIFFTDDSLDSEHGPFITEEPFDLQKVQQSAISDKDSKHPDQCTMVVAVMMKHGVKESLQYLKNILRQCVKMKMFKTVNDETHELPRLHPHISKNEKKVSANAYLNFSSDDLVNVYRLNDFLENSSWKHMPTFKVRCFVRLNDDYDY